jgi:hypothetical protein
VASVVEQQLVLFGDAGADCCGLQLSFSALSFCAGFEAAAQMFQHKLCLAAGDGEGSTTSVLPCCVLAAV